MKKYGKIAEISPVKNNSETIKICKEIYQLEMKYI
jgi:hypothetical protein